jgi:hypothetical protein
MILGIWGRIEEKSPIRIGTAFFCNEPLLNLLGLNPNFTLVRSLLDRLNPKNESINLKNSAESLAVVKRDLHI